MNCEVIHYTPLIVASKAIRKCWNSEDKSDSDLFAQCFECGELYNPCYVECPFCECENLHHTEMVCGEKDLAVIERVGNKFNHKSTLRHCHITFDCNDVSTKTLLALTRYTVGKEISVQSTRYTTSKRSDSLSVTYTGDSHIDIALDKIMSMVRDCISLGCKNDDVAMLLPQAYNYSFIVTFNIESLQWFLSQREKKAAHWDIQNFAKRLRENIPESYKYLF
jgi:thymidylate synthase (FAD)